MGSNREDGLLDMIVDEKLVLQIKATERLHPGAKLQLFS
jgi:hypothetical protein